MPGDIVRLTKGYAAIWRQCLTLYSGKNGDILKIGDFCLTFNEHLNMSEPNPNLSMNQKNQNPINNGNVPNNGNNNNATVPPTTSSTGTVVLVTTTTGNNASTSNTASPSKINATSLRHSNQEYVGKATNSKPNARGGRNNQTRNNVKNDRR